MAAGDELLIADGHASHRQGMRKLFEDAGYVCTATDTLVKARELVEEKFFPAALVDLDLERPAGGIDLLRFIRERSRATSCVVLSTRRSFEGAVEALRHGATDVVLKESGQVQYLRAAVDGACDRYRAEAGDRSLLSEVATVLDDTFRVLLKLAHHVYHDISVGAVEGFRPRVLIVDSDQDAIQRLAGLIAEKDWDIAAEMNGGGALDKAGSQPFDVVAARDELMDLKGSMVIKSVQATRAETVGLVFSNDRDGRLERYDQGRSTDVQRPYRGEAHLVERLEEVTAELSHTQRDRRVIQAFRSDHEEFFRRYGELKMRVSRMLGA
jgi:DNA-binding NtrC family response regulator